MNQDTSTQTLQDLALYVQDLCVRKWAELGFQHAGKPKVVVRASSKDYQIAADQVLVDIRSNFYDGEIGLTDLNGSIRQEIERYLKDRTVLAANGVRRTSLAGFTISVKG